MSNISGSFRSDNDIAAENIISCQVANCMYNEDRKKCNAENVTIKCSDKEADSSDDTLCKTFFPKN